MSNAPALLYYGDDFTGATDALATAARCGMRSLLLLGLPDARRLRAIGDIDCLGIAGAARSMPPAEMHAELAPVAELARRLRPRVLHYKTCSTFDSSPGVGSIGEAVRVLAAGVAEGQGGAPVHVLGGQPGLGRYCLFGNLFATAGSGGEVYRLDRHPTMSRHPVTPMDDADLRRHLERQGLAGVGLVPWTLHAGGDEALDAAVLQACGDDVHALLWDVGDTAHLHAIGRHWRRRPASGTRLAVGPSSVVEAVAVAEGLAPSATDRAASPVAPARGPVLALAGSLSPVTAAQVAAAVSFEPVTLDARRLAARDGAYRLEAAHTLAGHLEAGRHVLACTVAGEGRNPDVQARDLAVAGGQLLAEVLRRTPVRRVGIAGGDTSSHAVRALDGWGLRYVGPLGPGAPLCRMHSDQPSLDGMELMLKGGQMGGPDIFERLVHGTAGR